MKLELATAPGTYRWYYVDVSNGEWSAVAIFMLGSLFSPRFVRSNQALPLRHAAVNFALYRRGVRQAWVLSEYPHAELRESAGASTLVIGGSSFTRREDGVVSVRVSDRAPWWRRPVEAELNVTPEVDAADGVTLVPGLSHRWFPYAVRAQGRVQAGPVAFDGRAYHDGNAGECALGGDLAGWSWVRTHGARQTTVAYQPREGAGWAVSTEGAKTLVRAVPGAVVESRTTRWGLSVPRALGARLLESSPFYARFEAGGGDELMLGEAADFARFRSPFVRWMADFRTRVVAAPVEEARLPAAAAVEVTR
ncbi:MAG: carotenoid 1,2-hydratase [Myxococcaceae bacterium]